jgi:putative nucleotidyltransferase with HDIG domain
MLSREEALQLVKENVKKENLIKHMLAVEAIMKKCAEFLGEDQNEWDLVGLLHDIDFDKIDYEDPESVKKHGLISEDILKGKVSDEIIHCIKSHNFENLGVMPESKMDYCMIAADAISGLVIACALVMPTKKLADVKLESVKKRFKQKDFARNCSRENMLYCEKAGIPMDKFYEISLASLQGIASDLGL